MPCPLSFGNATEDNRGGFLLPLPFLFRHSKGRGDLPLILVGCAVSSACVLIALSACVGVTARYLCDFKPLLFVIVFFAT